MDKKNLQRCHLYSWVNIFNIFLHHLQINLMFFFYSNICGCIYNWVQLNSIIFIKERARVQDIWDEQVMWDSKNRKSWSKENYSCTFLFYLSIIIKPTNLMTTVLWIVYEVAGNIIQSIWSSQSTIPQILKA